MFEECLLPLQQILEQQSPRVLLSGPPGTGITQMLIQKAKEWLQQGHTVMVISLWISSHAVSCYIDHQVRLEVTSEQADLMQCLLSKESFFKEIIGHLQTFQRNFQRTSSFELEVSSLDSRFIDLYQSSNGSHIDREGAKENGSPLTAPKQAYGSGETGDSDMDLNSASQYTGGGLFSEYQSSAQNNRKCSKIVELDHHQISQAQYPKDRSQKLHVLVPEAPWFLDKLLLALEKFLGKDGFVIWVSTSFPGLAATGFVALELMQNLRCPPVVIREMMMTPAFRAFDRPRYKSQDAGVLSGMPCPTDGPRVKRIQHHSHREISVWDCELCGDDVATFLTQELRIVSRASGASASSAEPEDRLHFTDVVISGYLPDLGNIIRASKQPRTAPMEFEIISESKDPQYPTAGFLKGLRREGISYDIMDKDDVRSYQKLAVPEDGDGVQVAAAEMVKGMERKVVVVLGTADLSATAPRYVDPLYDVMGCCTSQLVMVGIDEADVFSTGV